MRQRQRDTGPRTPRMGSRRRGGIVTPAALAETRALIAALRPFAAAMSDESVRDAPDEHETFVRVRARDVRRAAEIVREYDERERGS